MEGRMTANAFERLLREVDDYRRVRDGGAPASGARPISGRETFRPSQVRKAFTPPAVPTKSVAELMAELREQGEKSRDLAKSLAVQTASMNRRLARDRIDAVAAKANESARAGRLSMNEAAHLNAAIIHARAALN